MQAVFLGSGPKSCGTGVFIPQTEGKFSKKPAFSSVLLPARVVQALNLNVHELDLQIKPQTEQRKNVVKEDGERLGKKEEEDDVIYISPDILLPKEWTY
ncbi:hypothetical protein PHJA_001371900 [Phtheirospermum japonicum]|uniref:Uncharacterized protein n=1 Tax=Phtheirospermum japonicum TaxID=374723 RepID=A0A830C592_9LAMI|nr:hypothetical protein PHJA_001371900 [Phtheirospermum japonicum]